jgi:hypothetical protein
VNGEPVSGGSTGVLAAVPSGGPVRELPETVVEVRAVPDLPSEARETGAGVPLATEGGVSEPWKAGVDGGDWDWCWSCKVSTPATERGECATCGNFIAANRCERCRNLLERDPVMGTHYAPCEECEGGESLDGDALRGQETQAESVDQQIEWQRLK